MTGVQTCALPISQNIIGYVQKVTGLSNSSTTGDANIITGDKCFLLSGKEIFGGNGAGNGSYCTTNEASATFQYQYFSSIATASEERNFSKNVNYYEWWWLRSPYYGTENNGFCICMQGTSQTATSEGKMNVFPAFCIY